MTDFYENLLKATSNVDDITVERCGVITKLDGLYCNVKEDGTGLEHFNVPIINGAKLDLGDKVVLGFINNSIYNPICYGVLDRRIGGGGSGGNVDVELEFDLLNNGYMKIGVDIIDNGE